MKTRRHLFRLLTFFLVLSIPIGIGCSTGGESQTSAVSWTGTTQTGTALFDEPAAVATDGAGNIYVAGGSNGDIDNCTCMNPMDGIVVKYGPSGEMEWVAEIEEDAWIYARGIVYSPILDALYVSGETNANLSGSAPGSMDIFLYRIGPGGDRMLLAQEGTPADDYANAVAADSGGNAYVAGDTFGSLDGIGNAGSRDAFVMKIDRAGVRKWVVQIGSADIDRANGVALDATGNAYVVGYTFGSLGSEVNQGPGYSDVFLAKVDPSGALLWTKMLGTPLSDIGTSVALDPSGCVFVAGYTGGRFSDVMINAGHNDAFVAKFAPDGTRLWVSLIGTTEEEYGYGVTTDDAGFVYLAGQTGGSLRGATSSGLRDAFMACFKGGTGEEVWVRQFGTDRDDCAHAVTVDAGGSLFVAGDTFGGLDGNLNLGCCDLFVAKFDHEGNPY